MAVIIRHGTNGGFKTASAIGTYVIPALKAGRTVVSNVRGLTLDRCYNWDQTLPSDLDVILVDTDTAEGLWRMATWFHWVPLGALVIMDEASNIYPKSWRETDLKKLEFPGGPDAAAEQNRPHNWLTAFEKQRHYGWDCILTTPNIKGIRDDIRNTTEMAFRHRRLGGLSSFGMFKEVQHDPAKNGFSASEAINTSVKHINKEAYKLYDSTITGNTSHASAGKGLLGNPKFIMLALVLVAIVGGLISTGGPSIAPQVDSEAPDAPLARSSAYPAQASESSASTARRAISGPVGSLRFSQDYPVIDPFAAHSIRIVGTINGKTHLEAVSGPDTIFLTPTDLAQLGYDYFPLSDCLGKLVTGETARIVMCSSRDEFREGADRSESSADDQGISS